MAASATEVTALSVFVVQPARSPREILAAGVRVVKVTVLGANFGRSKFRHSTHSPSDFSLNDVA